VSGALDMLKRLEERFMGIDKYKKPKRKNYRRLRVIEEQLHKINQLECEIELLQKRAKQLGEKNIQLRSINSRYAGLFAVFMCKCVLSTEKLDKKPIESLNEIYLLSRKMLEGIK